MRNNNHLICKRLTEVGKRLLNDADPQERARGAYYVHLAQDVNAGKEPLSAAVAALAYCI